MSKNGADWLDGCTVKEKSDQTFSGCRLVKEILSNEECTEPGIYS